MYDFTGVLFVFSKRNRKNVTLCYQGDIIYVFEVFSVKPKPHRLELLLIKVALSKIDYVIFVDITGCFHCQNMCQTTFLQHKSTYRHI